MFPLMCNSTLKIISIINDCTLKYSVLYSLCVLCMLCYMVVSCIYHFNAIERKYHSFQSLIFVSSLFVVAIQFQLFIWWTKRNNDGKSKCIVFDFLQFEHLALDSEDKNWHDSVLFSRTQHSDLHDKSEEPLKNPNQQKQ